MRIIMCERCTWVGNETIYIKYHDEEWGVPEWDARALWEKLVLDGFQAGLSWLTILKKRDGFRAAFAGFDPHKVAEFGDADVERLLGDAGIVRHRGKINAAIKGARAWQEIDADIGVDNYLWGFVDGKPLQNNCQTSADVPAFTDLSTQISKDLKKRGFNFCGPTIVYAFMQAMGMVNDHTVTCYRHKQVQGMVR
jgi:DNA-3-methyladenine glycosylase I